MIRFEDVSYTYPFQSSPAVSGINLTIKKGEVILCTGGSGSGKSTIIRLINSLAPCYYRGTMSGRVTVNGMDTGESGINEISKTVGTMFQDPEHQFFALNTRDEMGFAMECRGISSGSIEKAVKEQASRFGLLHVMDNSIFDLSEGEKQKLALGSILALDPEVIILDEPSANLDPEATLELACHLAELKNRGITLFISDHRLYWLRGLIDRVIVLEHGRIAETITFSDLDNESIRSRYGLRSTTILREEIKLPPIEKRTCGDIEVQDLTFGFKNCPLLYDRAEFIFSSGDAVAVTGKNGAGKTSLARILTGLHPLKKGRIMHYGKRLMPKQLLKKGSIVLQNTDHQLHMKTVEQELVFSGKRFKGKPEDVDRLLEQFGLESFRRRHPQSLSGGQKQRLVIAAAIIKSPEILILDEPTSGLDGTNMQMMSKIIRRLAEKGTLVIVITHDLELIQQACNCELALPLQTKKGELI
jgi:energy-coupling factor transport system ATP-binding protein